MFPVQVKHILCVRSHTARYENTEVIGRVFAQFLALVCVLMSGLINFSAALDVS